MLIRFADGRSTFVDFRERAPGKASRDMYLDASGKPTRESLEGWKSAGVPGTVRGFELAHRKYGSRKWAGLVEPAAALAAQGFQVSYPFAESLKAARNLAQDPESKRIFLKNGTHWETGETLTQPELARTLRRIAQNGANEFYQGETAQKLAEAMARKGGLITLADLKDYAAVERTPLTGIVSRLRDRRRAPAEFRRCRDSANAGDARRLRIPEIRLRLRCRNRVSGRSHAALLRRPQPVPGRSRFRKAALDEAARSRLHQAPQGQHRSEPRHAQRADPARPACRPRRRRDHAL